VSDPAVPTPLRAWVTWSLPALLFLVAFMHRGAPGIIAKDLMHEFAIPGTIVGLLSATYFYAYAGLMIPGGLLIDGVGVRLVVTAGGMVMGLGALAMGLAAGEGLLFVGRFGVGLGASVTFIGSLKVAATWFPPARFGFLAAVTATVGVLGALVSTAPFAMLVGAAGWRGALEIVGGATLVASVLCWVVVRDRPDVAAGGTAPGLRQVLRGMLVVLRNRHTWPPFLAFFCIYSAAGNLFLWVVPYLRDIYGLPAREAALVATAPSLALLLSGPLTGFLSDQVWRRRKLPFTALATANAAMWGVLALTLGTLPLWAVFALFFVLGLVGAAFVLTWPIGREVNPPHLAGIAVAVVNLGGFLGAALTQGPIGAVLDARWTGTMADGARVYPVDAYRAAFTVCAALALAAAALSLLLRETHARNVYQAPRAR